MPLEFKTLLHTSLYFLFLTLHPKCRKHWCKVGLKICVHSWTSHSLAHTFFFCFWFYHTTQRLKIWTLELIHGHVISHIRNPQTRKVWKLAGPIKSIISIRLKPNTHSLTLGPLFVSLPHVCVQNYILYICQQLHLLKAHGNCHLVKKKNAGFMVRRVFCTVFWFLFLFFLFACCCFSRFSLLLRLFYLLPIAGILLDHYRSQEAEWQLEDAWLC